MGKRKRVADNQLTFVPPGESQPVDLQVQPNIKGQLYEPDMDRFFAMDWKQVRVGRKQWAYWVAEAEEIMRQIRLMASALAEYPLEARHSLFVEWGLPGSWQEYGNRLKLLYQAYPQYLEWFANRVEIEYCDLEQKWNAWFDSAVEEGEALGPEFWALDCRICCYDDFKAAIYKTPMRFGKRYLERRFVAIPLSPKGDSPLATTIVDTIGTIS
jgi:hypothetical protein